MNSEVVISKKDSCSLDEFDINVSCLKSLYINYDNYNDLYSYKNKISEFKNIVNNYIVANESFKDEEDEDIYIDSKNAYQFFIDNFNNIYDKVDFIRFDRNINAREVVDNNPFLKTKNIVLSNEVDISDYKTITKLKNQYHDCSNVYISLQGNFSFVRLDECGSIMDIIKEKSDFIKSLNLSELEQIMVAYDMVRNRVYISSDSSDNCVSRDLKNVLFEKEIVCVGYANILNSILDNLGIVNYMISLSDKVDKDNAGHVRNAVRVNDSKYNVSGYYYLDATWDSKDSEDDLFLIKYRHFLRTRKEIEVLEKHQYSYNGIFYNEEEFSEALDKAFLDNNIKEGYTIYLKIIRTLNSLYDKVFCKKYDIDFLDACSNYGSMRNNTTYNKLKEDAKKAYSKLNKGLDAETILNLVHNVRMVENVYDSNMYPYSLDQLYGIYKYSCFKFSQAHLSNEAKFYLSVFNGDARKLLNTKDSFLHFVKCDSDIGSYFGIKENNTRKKK